MKSPTKVTITSAEEETFNEGKDEEETKLSVFFKELEQGVVLSKAAIRQLNDIFKTDDTDAWIGKEVVLFNDTAVTHKGKPTGGLRFRAAK